MRLLRVGELKASALYLLIMNTPITLVNREKLLEIIERLDIIKIIENHRGRIVALKGKMWIPTGAIYIKDKATYTLQQVVPQSQYRSAVLTYAEWINERPVVGYTGIGISAQGKKYVFVSERINVEWDGVSENQLNLF